MSFEELFARFFEWIVKIDWVLERVCVSYGQVLRNKNKHTHTQKLKRYFYQTIIVLKQRSLSLSLSVFFLLN